MIHTVSTRIPASVRLLKNPPRFVLYIPSLRISALLAGEMSSIAHQTTALEVVVVIH
jgi:hypothetical protein